MKTNGFSLKRSRSKSICARQAALPNLFDPQANLFGSAAFGVAGMLSEKPGLRRGPPAPKICQ